MRERQEIQELLYEEVSGSHDHVTQEENEVDPGEHYRIDELIDYLRECRESVAHFGLTLVSLLTRVILPERDRPLFVKLMQEKLGLTSTEEHIADRL